MRCVMVGPSGGPTRTPLIGSCRVVCGALPRGVASEGASDADGRVGKNAAGGGTEERMFSTGQTRNQSDFLLLLELRRLDARR